MARCGAVGKYRELYAKYPMTVVRVTSFLCGPIIAALLLLPIHELFGLAIYQRMYAPILLALACVHLFFLRKAAVTHIRTDHKGWDTRKSRFYNGYYRLLSILMVVFAMTIVWSLIEG